MKTKLTNKRVQDFLDDPANAKRSRLYDSSVARFYVQKLGSGGYFYLAYISPVTGKERYFPIGQFAGGSTVDQARKKAEDLRGRIIAGEDPQATKQAAKAEQAKTGQEYIEKRYRKAQSHKRTGSETIHIIEKHFADLLTKPIAELTDDDVIDWQARQQETGIKYTTLKRRFNAFKAMLNHAAAGVKPYILVNPIGKVNLEPYRETPEQQALKKARRDMLTAEQEQDFLAALDDYEAEKRAQRRNSRAHGKPHLPDLDLVAFADHVKPVMLTLFYTGFRKGDVIGLRWEHVNFDFCLISKVIEKTSDKKPDEQHFHISPPLMDAFKAWHKQAGKPKKGLVFPSPITGNRLDETALQNPWKKIRNFAKLPEHMQLYSLRHNFASHLVMDGENLLAVAKMLGHSDVSMIVKHYGHLQPSHLQDIAAGFAARVSANSNSGSAANVGSK
jgi:integrase